MATIVGGLACSHIPAIGNAIALGLQEDEYWKPFFAGFPPIHDWLRQVRPDVAVVIYNDHGLNFFLDKMPTFAVGAAPQYHNADEGWGIPTLPALDGCPELSWRIIEHLIEHEFDLVTCQEMLVDHGFTIPLKLFWPKEAKCPVLTVPICINTVQFPLPSAKRCFQLGRAVGDAVRAWDSDRKVVIIGTGGLSHQLDGPRAGFINKRFDLEFLDSMQSRPEWATQFSIRELVEKTGTQGVELLNWLAMRGALEGGGVEVLQRNYHIPISNTAAATIALSSHARAA